jgi:hypothetical protein
VALLPIIAAGADLLVAEGLGARDADASPATLCVRERRADRRKSGSQWTRRWRKPDSNHRSRGRPPPPS